MNTSNGQKTYDVILVAGEGKASYKVYHQNKAFLTLQGQCVILYVIEALQQVKSIGDIYIVGLKNKLEQVLHSTLPKDHQNHQIASALLEKLCELSLNIYCWIDE